MSNEESSCRSGSVPEAELEKEKSVGCGTVNCGILAARAAAAVVGAVLALALAICRESCSDMLVKSWLFESLGYGSCEESEVSCPFPCTLLGVGACREPGCLALLVWSEDSRFLLLDDLCWWTGCILSCSEWPRVDILAIEGEDGR